MASKEERERIARDGLDAYTAGNVPGMLGTLSEDVEVFASGELVNSGRFHGHEGFLKWIGTWTEAWEDIGAEITETIPIGDRHVIAAAHQTGRGRSGIEVSMDVAFLFEVQDGSVVYLALVPNVEEAMAIAREREAA